MNKPIMHRVFSKTKLGRQLASTMGAGAKSPAVSSEIRAWNARVQELKAQKRAIKLQRQSAERAKKQDS